MDKIDKTLRKLCEQSPNEDYNVVITLSLSHQDLDITTHFGIKNLQSIPGLRGIWKGLIKGSEILKLADEPEIEAIEPDAEAHMF